MEFCCTELQGCRWTLGLFVSLSPVTPLCLRVSSLSPSIFLSFCLSLFLCLCLPQSLSLCFFLSLSLAPLLPAVFILLTPNHCISPLSIWTQRLAGWKWLGYLCESSYDCVYIHIRAQKLRCTWTPELEVFVTAQHVHLTDFYSYYCHCLVSPKCLKILQRL